MEKCGKHKKQRKTSETLELDFKLGANVTTERGRKHRKTTENIGNVGIGTGGNMVHDTNQLRVIQVHASEQRLAQRKTLGRGASARCRKCPSP